MPTQIYVNLPVADLDASVRFFTSLGYRFDARFTDATATCMVVSDTIFVMLLTREKFASFTTKPVADATRSTEVLICLSCDSREQVDELVRKALAAGGSAARPPQDHGFMYGHGYTDLDGHVWELMYMDPAAASQG